MIRLIDIVYKSHNDITDPLKILEKHAPSTGFADFIRDELNIRFIKHLNYEGTLNVKGIEYIFFKRRNGFWNIPFRTHSYIKSQRPDVVLIEGLVFPIQAIALKMLLGKKIKIIAQHHGGGPFTGIKKIFQKIADKCIDAYMFTSCGNAEDWVDKKIIKNMGKCTEVLEASTFITRQDKEGSKKISGINGSINFLWVGRLNANKDPVTLLKAFKEFAGNNPAARLYMIYQTEELLLEIKALIDKFPSLKRSVFLKGKIPGNELMYWYSAADFYVSASHREGSGYALLEAMACGCIPIVTGIPSFKKITSDGKFGFMYEAGNAEKLLEILNTLNKIRIPEFSAKVALHFKDDLSFKNIANDIYSLCRKLTDK